MYTKYESNNSGGDWWLGDDDWKALEAAGWTVVWTWLSEKYDSDGGYVRGGDGLPLIVPVAESGDRFSTGRSACEGDRWLGALAKSAYRSGLSLMDAVAEWEGVTGKSATDAGCPCCGLPHHFAEYDDAGKCVASGPETSYTASFD